MSNFDATNLGQGATNSAATTSTPDPEDTATDITTAAADLNTIIDTLCPDGVEWKALGECSEMQRGTMLTQKDVVAGDVPVISGGVKPAYYHNAPNRTGETVTVASSGASSGYVQYWNQPIYVNDAFSVKGIPNLTDTKFLYYYLKNIQPAICATKIGGGVPHVRIDGIKNFRIPVPPLAVQAKIVQILNRFTELAKELAKEKQARRAQYEYYRDWLLDLAHPEGKQGKVWDLLRALCPNGVEWKTVRECCNVSIGEFVKKDKQSDNAPYPVYNGGTTNTGFYEKYNTTPNKVIISARGASAGFVNKVNTYYWAGNSCYTLDANKNTLSWEYLYYALKCKERSLLGSQAKSAIPAISKKQVENFRVPVPPLPVQAEIVRILDQFSTLAEDITAGLPAEIAARQTQYAYYRNQLLSFRER